MLLKLKLLNIYTVFTVYLIIPEPVYLVTVREAHNEYNSLIDQIQAKYKLLDSGEHGTVGIQHLMLMFQLA